MKEEFTKQLFPILLLIFAAFALYLGSSNWGWLVFAALLSYKED